MTLSQGQRGNDFLAQIGYPHFDEERIDKKELCLLKFSSIKIVKPMLPFEEVNFQTINILPLTLPLVSAGGVNEPNVVGHI